MSVFPFSVEVLKASFPAPCQVLVTPIIITWTETLIVLQSGLAGK